MLGFLWNSHANYKIFDKRYYVSFGNFLLLNQSCAIFPLKSTW
jgi:hypothetical protein